MRSKIAQRIVFCLLAALALLFIATPRSVTAELLAPEAARAYLAALGDTADDDALYVVTVERMIGSDETFVFLPRVDGLIRDVGTSGSSDWSVTAAYAAYRQSGGALVPTDRVAIGDSTLTVAPAANTAITRPNHAAPAVIDLDRDAWGKETSYPISLHASTRDSSLPRDVPETCRVEWSGEFFVQAGLLRHSTFPFAAARELPYRSNV